MNSTFVLQVACHISQPGQKEGCGSWGGTRQGLSPQERSICVSSSAALAGLSDTITEELVSCDSAGETPPGPAD